MLFRLWEQDEDGKLMGDRLEMLEDELFCLGEAVDYLGRVRGCEDVIRDLEDKMKVLAVEKEQAEQRAAEAYNREMDALRREYFAAR